MSYHEPSADEFLQLDPDPDDEAWEAYLDFVMPLIGSADANGLDAAAMARLEEALGLSLPYEVGLFLTIGVPDGEEWWQWTHDAERLLRDWNENVTGAVVSDVEHSGLWLDEWGARPADAVDRAATVAASVAEAPPLLPLRGHQAIVLGRRPGAAADTRNPVVSVVRSGVTVCGDDLAAWLHAELDAPLPMWPAPTRRSCGLWSQLMGDGSSDERSGGRHPP